MENFNIILTGLARSGKDTAAEFIERKYKFNKFVLSDFIKKELKKKKFPQTKEMMSLYGDELRKKHGMDIVARIAFRKINKKKNSVIVGARSLEEVEFFKKKLKNVFVVLVKASLKKRFERQQEIKKTSLKEFSKRDELDKKNKGLLELMKKTDFALENSSNKKILRRKIAVLMENIYKQKC